MEGSLNGDLVEIALTVGSIIGAFALLSGLLGGLVYLLSKVIGKEE